MAEENDYYVYTEQDAHIYETEDEALALQSENDSEMEEMECALYARIHFQQGDGSLSDNTYGIEVFSVNPEKQSGFHDSDIENLTINQSVIQIPIDETRNDSRSKISVPSLSNEFSKNPTSTSNKRRKVTVSFDDDKKVKRSKVQRYSDFNVCSNAKSKASVRDTDSSSDMEMAFDDGMLVDIDNIGKNLKFNVKENQQFLVSDQVHRKNDKDGDNWLIVDEDKPKLQLAKKLIQRYHQPLSVTCFNCKEKGHLSRVCPKPQKSIICIHCGVMGHNWRECFQVACFNCGQFDHMLRDCPHPWKNSNLKCFRCSMFGHCNTLCPDAWRQFHMTIIKDRLKGLYLISLPLKQLKLLKNPNVWCYNCASKGHFGYQCSKERFARHTSVTYPFIAKYKFSNKKNIRTYTDKNYLAENKKCNLIENVDISNKKKLQPKNTGKKKKKKKRKKKAITTILNKKKKKNSAKDNKQDRKQHSGQIVGNKNKMKVKSCSKNQKSKKSGSLKERSLRHVKSNEKKTKRTPQQLKRTEKWRNLLMDSKLM